MKPRTMAHGKPNRSTKRTEPDRLRWLQLGILVLCLAVAAKMFTLQVLNHGFYVALAEGQHSLSERLLPQRGEILVRDASSHDELFPLATNRELRFIYAVPKNIPDPEDVAKQVAEALHLNVDEVLARLAKPNDGYEPIKHFVEVDVAEELLAKSLPGIKATPETDRYYPLGNLAAEITGFVGYQDDHRVGQYGIEGRFEKELAGEYGSLEAETDSLGRLIAVGNRSVKEAKDGDSLVLTIDRTVQHTACKKLAEAVEKHGADGGDLVIVNPETGAIIAMCGAPSYDPNDYGSVEDISRFFSSPIYDQFEPGSVIKTMTLGAALNEDLITPDTTFEDPGSIQIGRFTIRNAENKEYGVQTMNGVLEHSINTGAVHVAKMLGPEKFYEYMKKFGFGEEQGIELSHESPGNISSLEREGEIWSATGSYGQGLTVTPLQLAMAYAAIANDGVRMKPYIIDEIIKPNGFVEKTEPKEVERVMDEQTARTLKAMLVNVVRNGHGQRAAVKGYYIGGKTGTAQVPYTDRAGYDPYKHIGSFVGFGPLQNPKFVMLAKIDVPRDVQFAESSAAPLFGDIAEFLMQYYRIPPEDKS